MRRAQPGKVPWPCPNGPYGGASAKGVEFPADLLSPAGQHARI